jgi:hypothetical protein
MPQSLHPSTTTTPDYDEITSRDRSSSITISQKSRTSSSSDERRRKQQKKKPNAFKSFFAVKEPSAMAFQHLAAQMREEMGEKGQLPFGVPSGKIPASAQLDYKKAKEKAKENARLYQEAKERGRTQEEHDRSMQKARTKRSSVFAASTELQTEEELRDQLPNTAEAISYVSLDPRPSSSSSLPIPLPAHRKTHSRWKAPSLNSLPEATNASSVYSTPAPSMPATPSSPSQVPVGVRKDVAPWKDSDAATAYTSVRKQNVAPWENSDGEEEFPMRTGAKKSKGYFSTLIRR